MYRNWNYVGSTPIASAITLTILPLDLNDDVGMSFAEIADFIEANSKEIFATL